VTCKAVIPWLAVVAAFASAALWLWAAKVPLEPSAYAKWGGPTPEDQRLIAKQASLNGYAALATGISAFLQAVSLML
jgi:hypothetical protein